MYSVSNFIYTYKYNKLWKAIDASEDVKCK